MFKTWSTAVSILMLLVIVFSSGAEAGTLRRGDIGPRVEELQRALTLIGYEVEDDSVYDGETEDIIEDFQKEMGISVDGIYGYETREALSTELVNLLDTKEYTVEQGDTLSSIAESQNTSLEKIMILNQLDNTSIRPGRELEVPVSDQDDDISVGRGGENFRIEDREQTHSSAEEQTFSYTVQPGDTLISISARFDVDVSTIQSLNNLGDSQIVAGQELEIPGSEQRRHISALERLNFRWPTNGRITSDFGHRTHPLTGESDFHTGIDIAVSYGTPIYAAESGRISFSGWQGGYGHTIIIDHGDGIETLYAHNSQLNVNEGERVNKGEIIAYSGNSGTSSGPHLHFEIIEEGEHIDPLHHLP